MFFCKFAAANDKNMEKQDDLTLMKARSYRRVLAAGFRLYTENFRRLFKASWQMVLIYAVSCGALGTLSSIKIPEMTTMMMQQMMFTQTLSWELVQQYLLTALELFGLVLLAIATMSLASATLLNKLSEHKATGTISMPAHWLSATPRLMGRTMKGVFLTLLVLIIPLMGFLALMALADHLSPQFVMRHITTVLVTFCICTLIVMMLALPLTNVLMKYIMEAPCGYWRTLSRYYGRSLRHWGLMFLVYFVSMLLVLLASLMVTMPSSILSFANQQAHGGLLIGDPLGMPSYIMPLTFVTCMLCSFIDFYINQVTLVHNYYLYGSIETKEGCKMRNEK